MDTSDAVAAYLRQRQPADSAQASMSLAVGVNPDEEANFRKLSAASGIPVDSVRAYPNDVKQQNTLRALDFGDMAKRFPSTTAYLGHVDNARIAHDDVENMGLIETMVNSTKRGWPGLKQTIPTAMFSGNASILASVEDVERKMAAGQPVLDKDDPYAIRFMTPEKREKYKARILGLAAGQAISIAASQGEKQAIPQSAVVGRVMHAKGFGEAISAFMTDPVKFVASIGPESLVQNAPGLAASLFVGGAPGKALTMGAGSAATDYAGSLLEALGKEGVDLTDPAALTAAAKDVALMRRVTAQAMAHATVVSGVDAASAGAASKIALPGRVAERLATKPVSRELANMAVQMPVQGVMGGVGEAGGELAAGQPLDPGNILAEIVGESFTAPAEVGAMAAGQIRERMAVAKQAEQHATALEQLVKFSEASKLRARDPEAFKQFVEQVAEHGDVPAEFFIDPQQLANSLNQSGMTIDEFHAVAPIAAEQLQASLASGTDVRVPVSEFTAAGEKFTTTLVDHLRTTPDAMTRAEAAQFLKEQGAEIEANVAQALAAHDEKSAHQQSTDVVRQHFEAELTATKRFSTDVNKAYAALLANFYGAQAQRAGMTPEVLLQRYGLRVSASIGAGQRTLNQAGLLADDFAEQERFLQGRATERGFTSLDEFVSQDEAGFVQAAAQWRERHPADTLRQGGGSTPRAQISFSNDITASASVISLLAGSDLSGFLHESGHFFLEVQADLATRIQAQIDDGASVSEAERGIVADMNKLLDWFGIKGSETMTPLQAWGTMSLDEKRESHEQFARGFEAYAFEGKSPSIELQGIFQRFRSWLVNIYQSLRDLNVTLTDDVRAVMGRMMASEHAIEEAEAQRNMGALFKDAKSAAGMTLEEYQAYQATAGAATAEAVDQLLTRGLKDMQWLGRARNKAMKARQAQVEDLRREVRHEVTAEVLSQPLYRAWQFLSGKADAVDHVAPGTQPVGEIDTITQKGKLRTSALKELAPDTWEVLSKRRMTSEDNGMHPEIVAELFDFDSADALVHALVEAQPPRDVIDEMTDRRMLERYGDIGSEAALNRAADEAVHNELRARVITAELKALQAANKVRDHNERDALYGGRSTVDVMARAAKEHADQIIARLKIKDLRPTQYTAAEARSARLTEKAFAAGNLEEAAMHKRNQLINHYAAKAAFEAQAGIKKSLAFFGKVNAGATKTVATTRDADIVNAARAILAEYGLGTKGKTAQEYLAAVEANDPATFAVLRDRVDAMTAAAEPYKELTIERMTGFAEEIRSLWQMAKRSRQIEIDGQLIDRTRVTMALAERMEEIGVPDRVPGEGRAVTDSERRLSMLQSAKAALRRVESWVGLKDGDGIGPFRRYIWQPIREAADAYRADKAKYLKAYRDLLKTVDMGKGRIDARELGYTFGHSRGGSGKQEILHALLHTGNESNKRKLLLGRGWGSPIEGGGIDTSRWDAFVRRMIDQGVIGKADYDFVQGVWDLLDATKPLAQKAHRDVYGHYFAEITAEEVVTPFGTYRGGYVPAMADSEVVRDAKTRELMEQENSTLAYAFPATAKGFTKGRVEYNKPLLLDLRSLAQHIDKVLLFAHLEQPIRDVRRVLTTKEVAEPLNRIDPSAFDGLLTPWMNRVSRQLVEAPIPGSNGLMRFFSKARSRAGMAAMFANLANTAQQITGLSIAAVRVGPKHLLAAAAQWVHSPRQTARAVAEASPYMATRMDNEVAMMTDAINDILLNPSVYEQAQAWTAKHAYFMQAAVDNVVGPIVWNGAYNQALEAGESQRDAQRLADSAVRETQGSTLPEDVARFETGNAFVRMFTQFASYFNMQANLLGTEFSKVMHGTGLRKSAGRGLYVFVFGFLAPALVSELVVQAFRGGPDDDDKDGEYLDDWLAALGVGTLRSGIAMIPVVGQLTNLIINSMNQKPYDDRMSTAPAISMLESAARAPASVYDAVVNDGSAKKAIRDVATLISLTTGLPANAVARPLGYLADVMQDKVQPTGAFDAARGMATGRASPDSKH